MTDEAKHDIDLLVDEVDRRRRNDKKQKWGLFALTMLLLIAVAIIIPLLHNALFRADVSGAQVVTEQEEKKEIASQAQQALCQEGDKVIFDRDLCEYWADVAQEPVEKPEESPVKIGPSQAELVAAFHEYCDAGNCKGRDGKPATADDIAAAFVSFCADGRCTGPKGADGKAAVVDYSMVLAAVTEVCNTGICAGRDGADGADGTNGTDGANATQEMVLAAVQTVCANDACKGPGGATGATGPQGVSIVDVDCVGEGADSTWQITLSDGNVLNGGGPCKAGVIPPVGHPTDPPVVVGG